MTGETNLDAIPLPVLFVVVVGVVWLAYELGFFLGRVRGRRQNKEPEAPVGGIVGVEFGLLAFLLVFTFGIAANRFENRRETLLDEANAIGTTYLRSAMVPEPHRGRIRQLLCEYVDVRIKAAQSEKVDHAIRRSEELHTLLWSEAVTIAEKDPRSVPSGLFVQTLNDVIDLHAKRVTVGLRYRIPITIWSALSAVAVLSFAAMGYQCGLSGPHRSPVLIVVALSFATAIWLVADLDRPGHGTLKVSLQPLIDLRATMGPTSPG